VIALMIGLLVFRTLPHLVLYSATVTACDRAVLDPVLPGRVLGRRVEGARRGMTDALIGVVLIVAAATTCLAAPRLSLILTIDSPGVNQVIIPVAYWATVIVAAAMMSRRTKESFHRELARVFVVAFATHMLLLLGVSAARNLDRTAYATAVYWLYARAFYVAGSAASIAWVTQQIRARGGRSSPWSQSAWLPVLSLRRSGATHGSSPARSPRRAASGSTRGAPGLRPRATGRRRPRRG
jgi:hypothetical protein